MGIAMSRVSIVGVGRGGQSEGTRAGLSPSLRRSVAPSVINTGWGELQTRRPTRFIGLIGVLFVGVFAG